MVPLFWYHKYATAGCRKTVVYSRFEDFESMSEKKNVNVSCGACRVSPHYSLVDTVGEVLW